MRYKISCGPKIVGRSTIQRPRIVELACDDVDWSHRGSSGSNLASCNDAGNIDLFVAMLLVNL